MRQAATPPRWNPWRDRSFGVFAVGNLVNNIGESAYTVALPLLVYQLTGSLGAMAVLMAATPVALLLGPVLGAVVDRHGSRVLVVPGLLLQLVAAVCLNVLLLVDDAPLWPLFVLGYALASAVCLAAMAVPHVGVFAIGFVGLFVAQAACSVAADMMIFAYMTSDQVGRAAGFVDLVEGAPALASPAVVPVLYAAVGQSALFAGAAVVALLPAAVVLARWRRWEGWARDHAVEEPASGSGALS